MKDVGGAAAAVWCTVPIVYVLLLTAQSVALPGDNLGLRRFQTPQLAPGVRVGQTFTMTADGLYAIEVFPTLAGARPSGYVRFEVYDVTDSSRPVPMRSASLMAEDLIRTPFYRFEFVPIAHSKNRVYRLDVLAWSAAGVAFLATRGERYEGGTLHMNNQGRWADMAFRTYAPFPPSVGRLLMTLRETNPVRGHIVIAAFATLWLLLGFVVARMSRISERTGSGQQVLPDASSPSRAG